MTVNRWLTLALMVGTLTLNACAFVPFAKIPFTVALSKPASVQTAPEPSGLVRGDFDGDGHLDLVVVHGARGQLVLYRGDGTGQFFPDPPLDAPSRPQQVRAQDLNGDGLSDVLVLEDERLSAFAGDPDAGLVPWVTIELPLSRSSRLALGDFNADGQLDLVVGDRRGTQAAVLLGDGAGGFSPSDPLELGVRSPRFVVIDVDADGQEDLVAFGNVPSLEDPLQNEGSQVRWFPGGLTGWGEGQTLFKNTADTAHLLAAADLNGDGQTDLVANFADSNLITLLLKAGPGQFEQPVSFLVKAVNGLALADLDRDGDPEVVTTEDRGEFQFGLLKVLVNDGKARLREPEAFQAGRGPGEVVSGDFNEDGWLDLAVVSRFSAEIVLFFGQAPAQP